MDRNSAEVCWTDEQWSRVQKIVSEEAQKARIAASILPLVGPLDPTIEAIPPLTLNRGNVPAPPGAAAAGVPPTRLWVDTDPTLFIPTFAALVYLRSAEIADPDLSAALGMFRRAANVIALFEDALVFRGQPARGALPPLPPGAVGAFAGMVTAGGGGTNLGLLPDPPGGLPPGPFGPPPAPAPPGVGRFVVYAGAVAPAGPGAGLVSGVLNAISALQRAGHSGPFACVLGDNLSVQAHSPTAALILPRDRLLPFLDGHLYRSSTIPPNYGVLVALSGAPIELVVASDIRVRFLQQNTEPRFVFRVSERVALRVKELSAIAVLYR